MMKARNIKPFLRRLAFAAMAVLWCFVANAAYGFHHHDHGEEECEHSDCVFLQFSFHLPALPLPAPMLPVTDLPLSEPVPVAVPQGFELILTLTSRGPPFLPA